MFVEDVFDASLQRESTQPEYEVWLVRITNAKALGQNELLLQAKNFESYIFESGEYSSRNRSSDQFIYDLYLAHLFRDPTPTEIQA